MIAYVKRLVLYYLSEIKFLELDNCAGENGQEDVRVGVVAVFDGHIGKEASEMASKLVLDYFFVHSMIGSFKNWLSLKEEQNLAFQNSNEDVELEPHKSTIARWVPFDIS